MESVNGRTKLWKYLGRILPNSQIPYISEYVQIARVIMKKYWNPITTGDTDADEQLAAKIMYLSKQNNCKKEFKIKGWRNV